MFNNIVEETLTVDEVYEKYFSNADESWKKGALYIRVSTDDQVEYSPVSQLKIGLKYALEHQIFILKENIFQDDGISGRKTEKRVGFMKMISNAKIKPKPFEVVLVYSFSRFARNREDSIVYKSMLRKKYGIEVVSITQPLSDGKESILLESIYEAMDEYYSLDLSENTLRGKQEKVTRGEWLGNPPYGYSYDKNKKTIVIIEEQAKIVKMIFNDYINGMSIKAIATKLNRLGLKSSRGGLFGDRVLNRIVHNPAYVGKVRFCLGGFQRNYFNPNIQLYDGIHEPIIDNETWLKAEDINRKKYEEHFKYKKPAPKQEHWLRGIIKCGNCGKYLVKIKSHSRNKAYFQCNGYTKGQCEVSHSIREEILIPLILEQLKIDFTEKINININRSNANNEDILAVELLESKIKKMNDKFQRIKIAYANGIDTLEEYKENKERLTKEVEKISEELKTLKEKESVKDADNFLFKRCEEAHKILGDENVPEEIKYTISHQIFEKIVYSKKNQQVIIYYK